MTDSVVWVLAAVAARAVCWVAAVRLRACRVRPLDPVVVVIVGGPEHGVVDELVNASAAISVMWVHDRSVQW